MINNLKIVKVYIIRCLHKLTRLSQRGTALVLSPRMCVFMTMTARNDDKVISVIFTQK